MATLGPTTERTYGAEWWGSNVENQYCAPETMPVDGYITRIGVWCRGKDEVGSFKGVVWDSTRNTVLCQTATQSASSAVFATGNSLRYEADVTVDTFVAAGSLIHIGFTRNPSTSMQFSFNNTGTHFDDDNGSSTPSAMSGETEHTSREPAFYIVYETVPEVYLRRGAAWVQTDTVYTRRSSAWGSVGTEVYVRRSSAWVKA